MSKKGRQLRVIGNKVCFRQDSILEALNLLETVAGEF